VQGAVDRLARRDQPAREDVLVDPGVGVPGGQVAAVRHRDRLQADRAARLEQPVAGGEEHRPVLLADGLEHLDRDDLRVAALDLAVVAEQHLDPIRQACSGHPRAGQLGLGARDGRRRHPAAARGGGVDGEAAPAGADLEQVVGRAQVNQPAQRLVLARLRGLECVTRLEHGRGVGHGWVEERREEVVREVVVAGHVAGRARDRVALLGRHSRLVQAPQALQRTRQEPLDVGGEGPHRRRQVVGGPVARHVRLAEPDLARRGQPVEERIPRDRHHRRAGAALGRDRAVGQDDPQRRVAQPAHGAQEEPPRDGRPHRRPRRHRDAPNGV